MMGLFSTVPGGTRLYLAVPGSAQVCHDLPYHKLPLTATDWLKCFCTNRPKCSKAIYKWIGYGSHTMGWMEINERTSAMSTALLCIIIIIIIMVEMIMVIMMLIMMTKMTTKHSNIMTFEKIL